MSKSFRFNKKEYGDYSTESVKKQKSFRKERLQRHNREDYEEEEVAYIPQKQKNRKHYYDER